MAGTTTVDLNGLFKQAYADDITNLVPEESVLTRSIKFQGRSYLLGNTYNQPVIVRSEQGFTYSRPNNGAFALRGASSMKTQNAVVDGFSILEQSGISYEAVARSDNVNSFRNAVDLVMQDAMESFSRRLEIGLLYGQSSTGLGKTTATATAPTTTTVTFAFAVGQWAAGLWTPLEGAELDVYNAVGAVLNTNSAVVVQSINIAAKTVTVTASTADVTAITTYLNGTGGRFAVLRFYSAGSNGADEAIGLDKIMENTGTLFGIDANVYSLWKANTFDVAGALTLPKILNATAVAAARGLAEDVELYISPASWSTLANEQMTYRMFDSSYSAKKTVNGTEALEFHSQTGTISVIAHKYVKEGDAFMLPTKRAVRIGSTDITFDVPGSGAKGQVFIPDQNAAGFSFRIFSQQSLLVTKPALCVKMYGIV